MEAICSSETSVGIQRITRRYIPENRTIVCYLFADAVSTADVYIFERDIVALRIYKFAKRK
jgi:hypothetical protein